MDMLEDFIRKHKADYIIIAFDPPPPVFRHLIYPPYKDGRPPAPDEFIYQCDELKNRIIDEGYTLVEVDGFEADDVIGTLSTRSSRSDFNTMIATCDLDLLQLVTDNVSVELFSQYWPTRMFDIEKTMQRFKGLSPSQIPDYKALAGDRLDNLPGVPGIGDVTATVLLHEKGTIEGIYADLNSIKTLPLRGVERIFDILSNNKEQAFLMKELATIICDLEIDVDIEKSTNPLPSAAELILS